MFRRFSPGGVRFSDFRNVVETGDLINWWDALEYLFNGGKQHKLWALHLARQSRHPDAQWLASLLPEGAAISTTALRDAMWSLQDEDPRAMCSAVHVLGQAAQRRRAAGALGRAGLRCRAGRDGPAHVRARRVLLGDQSCATR
jgi:hypothetical protein